MIATIRAQSSFVVGSCCYHTAGRLFVSRHLMQVLQAAFLFLFLVTCVTGSCWDRTINGPRDQVESIAEIPRLGVRAQLRLLVLYCVLV